MYYIKQMRPEPDESTSSVEADCIVRTTLPLRSVLQSFITTETHVQDSLSSVFAMEAVPCMHLYINAGAASAR
jgi:hypothetical protein